MGSTKQFLDYVLNDVFHNISGISNHPMFGSYALYKDGVIFGIISNNRIYFKANKFTDFYFKEKGSKPFIYKGKNKKIKLSYWELPEDVLDDKQELIIWIERSMLVGNKKIKLEKENRKIDIAIFGAGCFWGVEEIFRQVSGVLNVVVGYMGGEKDSPTYKEVCLGNTGYIEVVKIVYQPGKVGYKELLEVFWWCHDPTSLNKQGVDFGSQYRSIIFFHNAEQEKLAKESKSKLARSGKINKPIVTEILSAKIFWPAEEYHQQYFKKMGQGSCSI